MSPIQALFVLAGFCVLLIVQSCNQEQETAELRIENQELRRDIETLQGKQGQQ